MASGKSDYAEAKILDAVFGASTLGAPATWYLALYTASPSDSGGGTEVSGTGTGYVRLAVTNNSTNFPVASTSGGVTTKSNGTELTWAVSTAAWGTIVAVAFFDASSGGNMWYWGDISAGVQQNINAANQQFVLRVGDLDITED